MSKVKNFAKSTIIYFVGNVLIKLVTFILLPITTTHINQSELGYYDTSTNTVSFFGMFIFVNIWSVVLRSMYDFKSKNEKYFAVNNGIFFFVISLILFTISFAIFSYYFSVQYLLYIYMFGLLTILHYFYGNIVRGFGLNFVYMISGVVSSFVNLILTYILLVKFNFGIEALYLGVTIGYFVQILIIEFKIKLLSNFHLSDINIDYLLMYIKFSIPLSVITILTWFLDGYNRLYISRNLGYSANGLYSVAGKFSGMLFLVSSSIILAWQELAFYSAGQYKEDEKSQTYKIAIESYIYYMSLGMSLLFPVISIVFPILINQEFYGAYVLIPPHMLATSLSVLMNFLSQIFYADRSSLKVMVAYLVSSVVNFLFLPIAIYFFSIQGSSFSMILAYLVGISLLLFIANKNVKLSFFNSKMVFIVIAASLSLFLFYINNLYLNIIFIICVGLIALYINRDMFFVIIKKNNNNR